MTETRPIVDLSGRRAVVTGASRGFGAVVAETFARAGAAVAIAARSAADLEAVCATIRERVPHATVEIVPADVTVEADVERLARDAADRLGGVDVLVCNAGIWGPKGAIETVALAEWTEAVAINLFGPVMCARAFSKALHASERGKAIILSGGGATKPMANLSAYAASKSAVVRFGETLALEWAAAGIDVNMLAPGAMNTGMLDELLAAGPSVVGEAQYKAALEQQKSGGAPMDRAALCCAYLASRASDGITGKLISAVWDPWETLPAHRERLAASDIYTLRRVVPEDRGEAW